MYSNGSASFWVTSQHNAHQNVDTSWKCIYSVFCWDPYALYLVVGWTPVHQCKLLVQGRKLAPQPQWFTGIRHQHSNVNKELHMKKLC